MFSDIEEIALKLKPVIQGVMNYYCKFWTAHTHYVWYQLNARLLKWVRWEKGLYKKADIKWLKQKYKEKPRLFPHWQLVHPLCRNTFVIKTGRAPEKIGTGCVKGNFHAHPVPLFSGVL
jgi:Group II intron, maturase-specific domain